jgi:phosphatidylethanolamine-binding protein (PEBP) family uncharacterized protein
VGRVVGDVIDMFVPSVDLAVQYTSRQVSNGCQMKPSATVQAPNIEVADRNADNVNLFTLIMTDPDAPSPSELSMREWVHWIVTDIPGSIAQSNQGYTWFNERVVPTSTAGKEVVPYVGPRPPIGIHRYIFMLFKQPYGPLIVCPPTVRNNFNTRNFAAEHGLGLPVAATYFNAQKEPGNRRR